MTLPLQLFGKPYYFFALLSVLFILNFFLLLFFFPPRKTLQFQWTGAETGTFLLETNISGEQIMSVHSVI